MSRATWAIEGPDEAMIEISGHQFGSRDDGAPMLVSHYLNHATSTVPNVLRLSVLCTAARWVDMSMWIFAARAARTTLAQDQNFSTLTKE